MKQKMNGGERKELDSADLESSMESSPATVRELVDLEINCKNELVVLDDVEEWFDYLEELLEI